MPNSVIYLFAGALLTFIATGLVEVVKNWIIRKSARKNFSVFLRLQLEAIKRTLDRIKSKYESSSYYDIMLMDELDQGIKALEESRRDGIHLKNERTQELFFVLVADLALFAKDIRATQNYFYDSMEKVSSGDFNRFKSQDELEKFDSRKRNSQAVDLIELKRRIDELKSYI